MSQIRTYSKNGLRARAFRGKNTSLFHGTYSPCVRARALHISDRAPAISLFRVARDFTETRCVYIMIGFENITRRRHSPRDNAVLTRRALKLLVWRLEFSNLCLSFTECSYVARARASARAASGGGRIAFEEERRVVRFNRAPLQNALSRA